MRKFLLSFLVVGSFLLYAWHYQLQNGQSGSNVGGSPQVQSPAAPAPASPPNPQPSVQATYRDGSYIGDVTDAFYGNVQVKAVISAGKITDVQFLDYPRDRQTSVEINSQAMPLLIAEAVQAQSAQVDIISGATQTSNAFIQSLQSALAQAK